LCPLVICRQLRPQLKGQWMLTGVWCRKVQLLHRTRVSTTTEKGKHKTIVEAVVSSAVSLVPAIRLSRSVQFVAPGVGEWPPKPDQLRQMFREISYRELVQMCPPSDQHHFLMLQLTIKRLVVTSLDQARHYVTVDVFSQEMSHWWNLEGDKSAEVTQWDLELQYGRYIQWT